VQWIREKVVTVTATTGITQTASHDLREAISERRVMELVLEEVQHLDEALVLSADGRSLTPELRQLLTIVTYCYSVGIYGSEDIGWSCGNKVDVRYAAANTRPRWEAIRSFRRAYRDWIETCLARVLSSTGQADPPFVPARRKLELAIMMDTAMCD